MLLLESSTGDLKSHANQTIQIMGCSLSHLVSFQEYGHLRISSASSTPETANGRSCILSQKDDIINAQKHPHVRNIWTGATSILRKYSSGKQEIQHIMGVNLLTVPRKPAQRRLVVATAAGFTNSCSPLLFGVVAHRTGLTTDLTS